jgi:orotate phosphoribosyltransferase
MNEKLRNSVLTTIRSKGYERRKEPFVLSSGKLSYDYVDLRKAFCSGNALKQAGLLLIDYIVDILHPQNSLTIGGMTMGADPLAHAVSVISGWNWFSVRKQEKSHGTQNLIEGTPITKGTKVVVIEDTTTTGSSLFKAISAVKACGGEILLAISMLNRSTKAQELLSKNDIKFLSIFTYEDLSIDPI